MATPCTKVANALATGRRYLKFYGTMDEAVTIKDRDVILFVDLGATLTRMSNGYILIVDGASNVEIYDLAINGASGNGTGIWLPPGGSQALTLTRVTMSKNNGTGGTITASGGTLTLSKSTLSENNSTGGALTVSGGTLNLYQSTVALNTGGGISLTAASFDLENNIVAQNGAPGTMYGGLLIRQLGGGAHTIEFNTITQNSGGPDVTTGVLCQLIAQPISFGNNIVYGNSGMQVSGQNCAWTYSDIGPDTVAGTTNMNVDPLFDPDQGNFRITGSSMVINQADPDATLAVDIDGDARPQGGRRDIGADESIP